MEKKSHKTFHPVKVSSDYDLRTFLSLEKILQLSIRLSRAFHGIMIYQLD